MRKVLVTGSAGFIGFHLSRLLLDEGFAVVGYDGMTDYYDVRIKQRRHQMLLQHPHFSAHEGMLEDFERLRALCMAERPDVIVHLAAQAGVRYSLENPRAYIDANIVGTFNVMECARELGVDHLLMASTSSVYGANEDMPFDELERVETQMTLYAATKKANESMGHSYAHLWNLPTTMFRFFTVYGPWGRPDMAYWLFAEAIEAGRPIVVNNFGDMARDFTYVDDVVEAMVRLLPRPAAPAVDFDPLDPHPCRSWAPHRVYNVGNHRSERLLDLIAHLEEAVGKPALRELRPMPPGDVRETWAEVSDLMADVGYRPDTPLRDGVGRFVDWLRDWRAGRL